MAGDGRNHSRLRSRRMGQGIEEGDRDRRSGQDVRVGEWVRDEGRRSV